MHGADAPWATAKEIKSTANPLIKQLARLRERRERRKSGLYLIEGEREARRALAAGVKPRYFLVAPELLSDKSAAGALYLRAAAQGAKGVAVSAAAFKRLSLREGPDGVMMVGTAAPTPPAHLQLRPGSLALILDGLEKPGNLGAILRTADAMGVDALYLTGATGDVGGEASGTDLENPNVIRASMGSVFTLPTAALSREEALSTVKAAGLRLLAAVPGGSEALWDADLTGGVAVLLGAEHAGLPRWWLEHADATVTIPMRGETADSLNVSVAGALLLYEAARQRRDG